jgi:hypothetical protein
MSEDPLYSDPALLLVWRAGQRAAPGDPFGEVELQLAADGWVRLTQWRDTGEVAWSGRTTPDAARAIIDALRRSPFPALPEPPMLPPGAGPVAVSLSASGRTLAATSNTWSARRIEGFKEANAAVDLLIRAASGGLIRSGWGEPPPFFPDPG